MTAPDAVIAALVAELRILRMAAGLTQARLARLIGVDEASVSNWERGRKIPSAIHLAAWAAAFGARLNLIGDDSE